MANSAFVQHEPCPGCRGQGRDRAGNNLARYADGSARCFACSYRERGDGTVPSSHSRFTGRRMGAPMIDGEYAALNKRRISEETCRHLDYRVNEDRGLQIATYYDAEGVPVAQKIRGRDKSFRWTGEPSKALLYGQTKWGSGGKRIIVTEGEIDALSVDEALGRRWPVVSVPNGAPSAREAVAKQIEWLDSFQEVVLFFDQDEPGQKAALECAELFAPGKAKIVSGFPFKDANEALVAGKVDEVVRAQYNARPYWPDDLIDGSSEDLWQEVTRTDPEAPYHYPWQGLDEMLYGIRTGELVVFTAGTGVGKSQTLREIAYSLLPALRARGKKLGLICLEESPKRTALGLMSLHLNKPLHLDREGIEESDLRGAFEATMKDVVIWRHWGSVDSARLYSKMRAMAAAGCEVIVLDHVSIVVSGSDEAEEGGGERRVIDKLMTRLRSMVEELGFVCFLVSHLRKSSGTAHEEGGEVHLDDLRGSGALKQLPDIIVGLERNQQAEDPRARRVAKVRVLKNRYAGLTGVATHLEWDQNTFRYTELVENPFAEKEESCDSEMSSGF